MASLGVTWPVGMTVCAVRARGLPTAVGVALWCGVDQTHGRKRVAVRARGLPYCGGGGAVAWCGSNPWKKVRGRWSYSAAISSTGPAPRPPRIGRSVYCAFDVEGVIGYTYPSISGAHAVQVLGQWGSSLRRSVKVMGASYGLSETKTGSGAQCAKEYSFS